MMKSPLEMKVSSEEKDYAIDWAPAIDDPDATIPTSVWEILTAVGSPPLTVIAEDIDGQHTVLRLAGGEAGLDYTIENRIITSTGEKLTDAIEVRVRTSAEKAGIS